MKKSKEPVKKSGMSRSVSPETQKPGRRSSNVIWAGPMDLRGYPKAWKIRRSPTDGVSRRGEERVYIDTGKLWAGPMDKDVAEKLVLT